MSTPSPPGWAKLIMNRVDILVHDFPYGEIDWFCPLAFSCEDLATAKSSAPNPSAPVSILQRTRPKVTWKASTEAVASNAASETPAISKPASIASIEVPAEPTASASTNVEDDSFELMPCKRFRTSSITAPKAEAAPSPKASVLADSFMSANSTEMDVRSTDTVAHTVSGFDRLVREFPSPEPVVESHGDLDVAPTSPVPCDVEMKADVNACAIAPVDHQSCTVEAFHMGSFCDIPDMFNDSPHELPVPSEMPQHAAPLLDLRPPEMMDPPSVKTLAKPEARDTLCHPSVKRTGFTTKRGAFVELGNGLTVYTTQLCPHPVLPNAVQGTWNVPGFGEIRESVQGLLASELPQAKASIRAPYSKHSANEREHFFDGPMDIMVPKLFLHVSQAAIFVEAVNTVNTVAINTILVLHLGKTGGLSIVRTCDRRNDPSYGYT